MPGRAPIEAEEAEQAVEHPGLDPERDEQAGDDREPGGVREADEADAEEEGGKECVFDRDEAVAEFVRAVVPGKQDAGRQRAELRSETNLGEQNAPARCHGQAEQQKKLSATNAVEDAHQNRAGCRQGEQPESPRAGNGRSDPGCGRRRGDVLNQDDPDRHLTGRRLAAAAFIERPRRQDEAAGAKGHPDGGGRCHRQAQRPPPGSRKAGKEGDVQASRPHDRRFLHTLPPHIEPNEEEQDGNADFADPVDHRAPFGAEDRQAHAGRQVPNQRRQVAGLGRPTSQEGNHHPGNVGDTKKIGEYRYVHGCRG